jgi:general secretion pathway protein L
MARLFIGIDIDGCILRMVSLTESGNGLQPLDLAQRELSPEDEAAEVIESVGAGWEGSGARMAMALPAKNALSRHLTFPFGERRKINAAVPLELDSRLPAELGDYIITSLTPIALGDHFSTIGLALPEDLIGTTLAPFDERQLPLRHLGIAPFAFSDHVKEQPGNCILLHIRSDAVSTLLLENGKPSTHRTSLRTAEASTAEIAKMASRDVQSVQRAAGFVDLPIWMFGSGLDAELQRTISSALPDARVPEEIFNGERLPAEFLPALALARLAASPGQTGNLRQGKFAFRGSLAPFKKQLIAAAVLLSVAVACLGSGAWLSYSAKLKVADSLQKKMEDIYRQTFPEAGDPPKDIPLHMTSRLNAARSQSKLFGGPGVTPLAVLEAVSRSFPEASASVVRDLNYDKDGIRLTGQSNSFEAVDQLAASLERESVFGAARISDAKTNIDGKRIDFRIDLEFTGKGGTP